MFELAIDIRTRALGNDCPHSHICTGARLSRGHICAGTGLTPATSAPGLGSPRPHLRRDCAHLSHVCPCVRACVHVRGSQRRCVIRCDVNVRRHCVPCGGGPSAARVRITAVRVRITAVRVRITAARVRTTAVRVRITAVRVRITAARVRITAVRVGTACRAVADCRRRRSPPVRSRRSAARCATWFIPYMRTRVHLHTITHVHTRARTRAQTRAHEQTHVHTRLARTAAPALRCRAISCAPSRARAATWAGHGGGRGRGHAGGGCGSEARERCGGLSGRRRAVAERPATPRDAGASVSLGHVLRSSAACCVPAHHNGAALRTDRKPHSLTTLTKARLRPTAAKPAGYAAPAAFNGQPTAYRAAVGHRLRPLTVR
jgi:hypothetical protein